MAACSSLLAVHVDLSSRVLMQQVSVAQKRKAKKKRRTWEEKCLSVGVTVGPLHQRWHLMKTYCLNTVCVLRRRIVLQCRLMHCCDMVFYSVRKLLAVLESGTTDE